MTSQSRALGWRTRPAVLDGEFGKGDQAQRSDCSASSFARGKTMTDIFAANLPPRLMTTREAAAHWRVCTKTFRKIVRQGIAPGPIKTGLGRDLYDREQQDRAISALRSSEVANA